MGSAENKAKKVLGLKPGDGLPQPIDRFRLQNGTVSWMIGKGKIFFQIDLSGTQRQMVPLTHGVVKVKVVQPLRVLQQEWFVPTGGPVAVADVQCQRKGVAFQQHGKSLLLESGVAGCVFNADFKVRLTDGRVPPVPKDAKELKIAVLVFFEYIHSPIGQCKIDPGGEVHIEHRDMEPLGQVDRQFYSVSVGLGHQRIKGADIQIFTQMDRVVETIGLCGCLKTSGIYRTHLILGEVHIQFEKLQS